MLTYTINIELTCPDFTVQQYEVQTETESIKASPSSKPYI